MIYGVDLAALKEAAKLKVQAFFVKKAESDGTPATLRAMYVLKAQEALRVINGETSDLIHAEAQLRGLTDLEMAQVINKMAEESKALEIARMGVNVRIETAANERQIVAILAEYGLNVTVRASAGSNAGVRVA
jgi:hypothetical protein